MPDALDTAVQALTAEGVAPDVARRAAVAALWRETGRLPSPGVEAPVDLLPLAREFVALAEAQVVATMQATGPLEDLATFAEEDAPAAGSLPRILREAHLLHPGTFNGHTFTRADLAEVVANFDPQDPPPIQLDHSLSARDTQGYVRALRMDGDKLRALLEFRGQEAESKVADGLWRKLSAGIYLKPKRRLKEVSVTPFPAVSGPEPARVLTEGDPAMDEEKTIQEALPEAAVEEPVEEPAQQAEPVAEEPAPEPLPAQGAALAEEEERQAILAAHEAEIARLRAELEGKERLVRLQEDTALVAEFVATGRSTPAMNEAELKFVQTLTPEQRTAYVALKETAPAYVSMGRRSMPDVTRPGKASAREQKAQSEALLAEAGYRKGEDGRWTR